LWTSGYERDTVKPVPHLTRILPRSAGQGRPAKVSSSFSLTQRCAQRPCYRRERYEGFQLLREDASQRAYTVPGDEAKDALTLPASFFLNGWHLILEPREIAMLLTILHAQRLHLPRRRNQARGVAVPEKLRCTRYGISGEVYDSIHQLKVFGLIDIIDIMSNRAGGKVAPKREYVMRRNEVVVVVMPPSPVPYEFTVKLDVPEHDAFKAVLDCLGR
jgi:hypothetical protein